MNRKLTNIVTAFGTTIVLSFSGGSALAGGLLSLDFQDAEWINPTVIDNPYWPLSPGGGVSTLIYIGETEDGCVFNKISADPGDMKVFSDSEEGYEFYDGLVAQVVVDREWELEDVDCETILGALDGMPGWEPADNLLGEWTFDWYRQDVNENIWYMGEASRDFGPDCPSLSTVPPGTARPDWPSDAEFLECTEGSWEAGQLGQEEMEIVGDAGIVVPGEYPDGADSLGPGTFWMQEVAENAEDMAKLLRGNASVSIEDGEFAGDYEGCRKVKEWTALEPGDSVEHKYYCAGVGLLLIQGLTGGPTGSEVLVLTTP